LSRHTYLQASAVARLSLRRVIQIKHQEATCYLFLASFVHEQHPLWCTCEEEGSQRLVEGPGRSQHTGPVQSLGDATSRPIG